MSQPGFEQPLSLPRKRELISLLNTEKIFWPPHVATVEQKVGSNAVIFGLSSFFLDILGNV